MVYKNKSMLCVIGKSLTMGFFLLSFISACATQPNTRPPLPTATQTPVTQTPTPTLQPSQAATSTISPTPTLELASSVCSPLQGIGLEKLHSITSNEYVSPNPYVESGHPAIDLSFYRFESFTTFKNFPLQAVLPGKVILVENNRFPYGYMLMVETPLSQVDPSFLPFIPQPTPLPVSVYTTEDRCPVNGSPVTWNPSGKSIYVLYAHLAQLPEPAVGQDISCGQPIGFAGTTGNSVEEHLHLEMRIGPSDAQFTSIAFQHSSATLEERYNYCIWSISGVFQPFDPAILLYP